MVAKSENPPSFIRLPRVKERTGLSRSSIYAKIEVGAFPPPINLGARAVAWIDHEIAAWMHARVRASRSLPSTGDGA